MGNAKYIGRVGALAVALGIGTAVATTPGVAVAEPSTDSSSADSPSSNESPATESTSTDDSKPATPADSSGRPHTAADTVGVAEPTDEEPADEADGDTLATPEPQEPTADEPTTDTEPATDPESTTPDQPLEPEKPAAEPVTLAAPPDNDGPATARLVTVDPPQAADPGAGVAGGADGARERATTVSVTSAATAVPVTAPAVPPAAVATQLVPAVTALPVPASPVSVVTGLVSGLLAWVGLSPGLANAPVAPAQAPLLWGLLAWVRREVQRTFFNQTPTTAYNPAENSQSIDGVITGDLNAVDADGDPVSFTVTQGPQDGSVVINPDGTFVYTPSAQLAATGGTDVFTVKVEDQGLHLHGLAGFFKPDFGHSATATVAITVNATIDVGEQPRGVAVSPDGTRAYVVNEVDGTVSVIDTATNTVTTAITVGDFPKSVAFHPDGTRAYVTNAADGTVSVINTATNTVTATINVGVSPFGVAVSPNGTRAYVANLGNDTVSVINTATNTVIGTIAVGDQPQGIAVSPDSTRAYVSNNADDSVSVINTATNTVITTIAVGVLPEGVAVSPDGARVYVANASDDDSVSVIDTATNTVIGTIAVGVIPVGVAVSPDGARAYVTNFDGGTLSVIDTATNTVTDTIAIAGFDNPNGVAVSPDGSRVYVTNYSDGTVSVIDVSATQLNMVALQASTAPAASGLFEFLEWVGRQVRHTFFNRTPTIAYDPAENSRSADGVITGDLRAVDPDGDPLTFTVTRAPDRGTVVINSDGTFTYTPNDEFARTGGRDTFTVRAYDGNSYQLSGAAGLIQSVLHRLANMVGISGPEAVDSHPDVSISPIIGIIDVDDGPTSAVVSPNGTTVYVANTFGDSVSVIDTATNTVTGTISFANNTVQGVAVSPDGTRLYVTGASRRHGVGGRHRDQHHHRLHRRRRQPG